MKISFYGAAREVTGSKHLLEVNGKKILLDCGLFQGNRKQAADKNRDFMFNASEVDVVILSHAHMDHSGLLPLLVKNGFKGPILCTSATRDLCEYMLNDSAFIQEREVEFMRQKHMSEPVEPLYTQEDVKPTLNLMKVVKYHDPVPVCEGVTLTFFDAGHILGSASVYLEIDDKEDNQRKTLTFTGDLGRKGLPILRDPEYVEMSDALICETTYGNRFHKYIEDIDAQFEKLINETAARGGKIIIPAFALERTQEVVYHLNVLFQEKRIPEIPIFVDSPLAVNVTSVFKKHPECFDGLVYDEFVKDEKNPFGFGRLQYITDVEDSKALNNKRGPMIIISASGMMEHGRVLHHLRNNIENPANLIMVVGYQPENTLGRKIIDGDREVKIFGQPHRVNAHVEVIDAFSGHADRSDLIDYITHMHGLKNIYLVHGEESQGLTFSDILTDLESEAEVNIPMRGQSFQL